MLLENAFSGWGNGPYKSLCKTIVKSDPNECGLGIARDVTAKASNEAKDSPAMFLRRPEKNTSCLHMRATHTHDRLKFGAGMESKEGPPRTRRWQQVGSILTCAKRGILRGESKSI